MPRNPGLRLVCCALLWAGCVSSMERGEELYRQGALREAVEVWGSIPADSGEHERARERLSVVEGELARMLRRFEKQAAFYEAEGRLGEAVLFYRLALKTDPTRSGTLERVQRLVRELERHQARERRAMLAALERGRLLQASSHAEALSRLDPFDPALQIEIRQVQAAIGAEVLRHFEAGRRAHLAADRKTARAEFNAVLRIDPKHGEALGYLSSLNRAEAMEQRRMTTRVPVPASISEEEILAEGHFRAGQEAYKNDEPYRALQEYSAALSVNSKHLGARRGRDRLRRDLAGQADELYAQGSRYFQEDDLLNALRSWRRVLLIDPDHDRAAENVERTLRILQRLEEIQAGG